MSPNCDIGHAPVINAAGRHYAAPPTKTNIDRVIFLPHTALDILLPAEYPHERCDGDFEEALVRSQGG